MHVFTNRVDRRRKLHREALLAELETDSDLILSKSIGCEVCTVFCALCSVYCVLCTVTFGSSLYLLPYLPILVWYVSGFNKLYVNNNIYAINYIGLHVCCL